MRTNWILAALLAAACTSPPPPAIAPAPPTATTATNATDAAWTQLMIALDEKILTVLELVPAHSSNPDAIALAAALASEHHTEINTLRTNLSHLGVPNDSPHAGHEMPGMVTAAAFTKLAAANGSEFDQLFAISLREHFDQCVSLARSELKSGADNATLALAAAAEKRSSEGLAQLRRFG